MFELTTPETVFMGAIVALQVVWVIACVSSSKQ